MPLNEKTLILTDSEQKIYDLLSDAEKELFKVLRLTRKVEQRELLEKLQDVTEAVREIQKRDKSFSKWLKDVMKYAVSIFKIDE